MRVCVRTQIGSKDTINFCILCSFVLLNLVNNEDCRTVGANSTIRHAQKVAFSEVKGERSKLVSQVDDFTRDQYLRKF